MKKHALVVAFLLGLGSLAQAQVVSYNFNQTDGTAANAGSGGTSGDLTYASGATYSTGVSGQSGDYAFYGSADGSGFADTSGAVTGLAGLTSYTITGWLNPTAGGGTILSLRNGVGTGIMLNYYAGSPTEGNIGLIQEYNSELKTTTNSWLQNTWTFFAITVTGSEVDFYAGTTTSSLALVQNFTAGIDSYIGSAGTLTVADNVLGGSGVWYNEYKGSLDNLAIYSGALDSSALESIRQAALVPEPTSLALLGLGAAVGLATIRRRSRTAVI